MICSYVYDLFGLNNVSTKFRQRLRSASSPALSVPRTRLSTYGDRAFPVATARVWNSLPQHVTSALTLSTFCIRLKTHYYNFFIHRTFVRACEVTLSLWTRKSFLLTYLLTLYFVKISFSASSESSCAWCSLMTTGSRFYGWTNCQKGPITSRLRYPVPGTVLAEIRAGTGCEKWPDIRPTGTGYPVHP